jgi:hypothetical protein
MTTAVGWIGATLILLAYAQTDLRRLRQVSVLGGLALLAFNIAMRVWPYVALELVLGAINIRRLLELRGRPTIELRSPRAVLRADPTSRRPSTAQSAPAAWPPPAPSARYETTAT